MRYPPDTMFRRITNVGLWLRFYAEALWCGWILVFDRKQLAAVQGLRTVKKIMGTDKYGLQYGQFTEEEQVFIAKAMWYFGWSTALIGCAFAFGFFGSDSPEQSFTREINPLRSILSKRRGITCSICMEGFDAHAKVATVDACGHFYHAKCLNTWLCQQASCPLCRATLGR